ncbi:MAG: AI-2E family transporter [Erysipelotrichaceae bacterium]
MKFEFSEDMKKTILTCTTIALISILMFFSFYRFDDLERTFFKITDLIFPFTLGFAIAFLLNGPMLFIENRLLAKTKMNQTNKRRISAICSLILGMIVVGFVLALLIPQLVESIFSLIQKSPAYLASFQKVIEELMIHYNVNMDEVTAIFGKTPDIISKFTNFFSQALPEMVRFSVKFTTGIFSVLLGVIAGLYILLDKEKFITHTRKATYAFLPKKVADYLVRLTRISADIFNNFIIGKAIDSLIIGILCYIGMNVIGLEYAVLLSVIVGTTNMIPVFGPFIGAVPGIFVLLIINPIHALYFALFVLVLQQFDGNILGPLILGDKLGLPSLWILFAVCVGGGLFGVVGMFIGVPIFAVIYTMLKECIHARLKEKQLENI